MCCLSSQQAVTPTEAREEVTAHCAHCIPNNTSFKLCLCQAEAPANRSPPHRCSAGKKIQQQRGKQLSLPALPTEELPLSDIRAGTTLGSLSHLLKEGWKREQRARGKPVPAPHSASKNQICLSLRWAELSRHSYSP